MAAEIHESDLTTSGPSLSAPAVSCVQDVCTAAFRALQPIAGATGGSIHVLEEQTLVPIAVFPGDHDDGLRVSVPLGDGVVGRVLAAREAHYVADVASNGHSSNGVRSFLVLPLVHDGRPIGTIQLDAGVPDAFDAGARSRLEHLARFVAGALVAALRVERLEAENDRLRSDLDDRRDVLSSVAHELKSPLTAVLGFAETLNQRAGALNPDMLSTVGHHLVQATRRLDRLIGDLLDATRLDRGTLYVQPAEIHIAPVVDQMIFEIDLSDHQIELDIPTELPSVIADPERLQQILVNLLSNATKYSEKGTTISVTVRASDSEVAVGIADRGVGIPVEQVSTVFEPFRRLPNPQRPWITGLGLGLYLVREICSAIGTRIEVTARPGGGSIFTIFVPRADVTPSAPRSDGAAPG